MLSQFYPLPTASRVHSCYLQSKPKALPIKLGFFKSLLGLFESNMEPQPIEYDTTFITPPRALKVPTLPSPAFHITEPQLSRFLGHYDVKKGQHLHPHLLKETPLEKLIQPIYEQKINSALMTISIGKGSLKITSQGNVYLLVCSGAALLKQLPIGQFATDKKSDSLLCHPLAVHIPVMTLEEGQKALQLGIHHEIDKQFNFTIKHSFYVQTATAQGLEGALLAEIESLELTELRERYLLPGKLRGHPLHMIILLQNQPGPIKREQEIYRLNVSCFAA